MKFINIKIMQGAVLLLSRRRGRRYELEGAESVGIRHKRALRPILLSR
jgi:hypothetical protein